jgi:hypothetical protein
VLRGVGTFPAAAPVSLDGVVPALSPLVVREVRHDMTQPALGATGYNPPPLVGLAAAGAFFHAGTARTLEEVFDPAFAGHHQALAPGFLAVDSPTRARDVQDLVSFLLSIDSLTEPFEIPAPFDLCPQLP